MVCALPSPQRVRLGSASTGSDSKTLTNSGMERCGPRPAVNRHRHESQRRSPIRFSLISRLGLLCLLDTLSAVGETGRKPSCFRLKKLAQKNLWNFSSRPLAISFCPDYSFRCCGRITVIHPHHAFFRKRAATDLVRDSIRQVVDWLRPVFSGSNALEEVASVSGVFPFWKMQTLRSE